MFDSITNAIKQTKDVEGDILFFRVFKGDNIIKLVKSKITNKHILIVHNSLGMEHHSEHDMEKDGTTCLYQYRRFGYSKRDLRSRLDSNLRNLRDRYSIIEHKTIVEAISKMEFVYPSVCIIDLIQYETTKKALDFSFDRLPSGGKIVVSNYIKGCNSLSSKAVDEFIEKNLSDIVSSYDPSEKCITIEKVSETHKSEPVGVIHNSSQEDDPRLVIACVLRTGGVYDYNYVNALANAVKKHVTVPHTFACLTNNSAGFNSNVDVIIKLKHDFPKWWCKIELFRPDIFNGKQIFFLDLDTVIIDNIDDIVSKEFEFCGLRDFYKQITLGSGLLSWEHDKYHHIYHRFLRNSLSIMNNTPEGDQRWIDSNTKNIKYFQDVFGNKIVSYKKDCIKHNVFRLPRGAKIVCFHGVPKPADIKNPQIKSHWQP